MKSFVRSTLTSLALAAALVAAPALAKNVTADLDQVTEILKGAGYKVEMKDVKGDRFISVDMDDYHFLILPFGCDDKGKACKSVQFFAAFDPPTSPSLDAMNLYARDHRWGRVYLDKDNDPAIEFDVDLEQGGMSPELFLDNVAYWEAIVSAYSKFIFDKDHK
ncbi:MAG: YbjN domain-containing protein [Novosphingobium sp.]